MEWVKGKQRGMSKERCAGRRRKEWNVVWRYMRLCEDEKERHRNRKVIQERRNRTPTVCSYII